MADDKRLASGTMIGAYRLTEQIGKGGFSTVWSAWDTRLKRLVAVKLLPLQGEDDFAAAQFMREASMIAQLQHPFIVPLYDFGKAEEHRYLVMRYVIGGSLSQRLQHSQRLATSETLRLVTLIASALDYVHEQQIVHRDLKPANILLDAQGLPYLSDFGLAKSIHQRATQHTVAGTLYYMSPEQYLGEQLTTRADIFSLGILLYQLLAGTLPHSGNVAHGALQLRHGVEERLPDITLVQPTLPPALNELLWQMTAFHPHDRPDSARSVVQRLAAMFATQESASIEQEALSLLQGVNAGSTNYRRLEAERILQRTLPAWQRGELPLSLTEFVLLHDYLQETPALISQPVGTLMLRSAFEYGQFIDAWWSTSDTYRQWLACDHAIASGGEATARALKELRRLIATQTDAEPAPALVHLRQKLTQHVAERLTPPSAFTVPALDTLDLLLEHPVTWPAASMANAATPPIIDLQLAKIAMSDSPEASHAAAVIGHTRRTDAVARLATQPATFVQLMQVRETAGSLPSLATGLSAGKRGQVNFRLGVRQLARKPLTSLLRYAAAAVGGVLGMGWLMLVTYPETPAKTLNVIGLGLLFGGLLALGLWMARLIASELRVLATGWRYALAMLAGGVMVAITFILFNQSVYDETLDTGLALACGVVFVAGTVISVRWARWLQVVISAVSIMLALLIPWQGYLRYYEGEETFAFPAAPFVFAVETVGEAIPITLVAALLMVSGTALVTGAIPWANRAKKRTPNPALEETPADAASHPSITLVLPDMDSLDEVADEVGSDAPAEDEKDTRIVPPPEFP